VNRITFVIVKKSTSGGAYPFSILRVSDVRQDVVSQHATLDDATEAALRYASQARFAGLEARIYRRDWLADIAASPPGWG
jgi:hypothetical protein